MKIAVSVNFWVFLYGFFVVVFRNFWFFIKSLCGRDVFRFLWEYMVDRLYKFKGFYNFLLG